MDRLLVLARHGQSDWNLKNLFTGWKDPGLTPLGVEPGLLRVLGIVLVAVTLVAFAVAALLVLGIEPGLGWAPMAFVGAAASVAVLVLFFHPWLTLGILVDLAIVWLLVVESWDTGGLPT